MKCLSVRMPWTYYLMHAGKDIENRGRRFPRNFRGRVLLQASKWWNEEEIQWDIEDANAMWAKPPHRELNAPELTLSHLKETRGCIIGSIEIVDYVEQSDSPWFVGDLGIVVRKPIPFIKPIPWKGMLGLFNVDMSGPEFADDLRAIELAA